jgi:hypothetical protein
MLQQALKKGLTMHRAEILLSRMEPQQPRAIAKAG